MAFDFPSSPTVGQIYGNYAWDGEKWISGTGGGAIYISDTAPVAPVGSLWYESDTGMLFIRYQDADSAQWVSIPGGYADAVRFSAQMLTANQQAQVRANLDITQKNYIINGAMQISQELPLNTASSTTGAYYADQFYVALSGTGVISTINAFAFTPGGSTNRYRVTVTTADAAVAASDIVYLEQRIEGYRVADLRFGSAVAKTVTLQFGCKGPAGTYSVVLMNGAANRSYVAEYVIAAGEANTDVVKSVTIPGDNAGTWLTDTGIGLFARWGLMVGTTFQQAAGAWGTANAVGSPNQFNFIGTVSNVFELFDVGLYEGPVAPPFIVPDYADELAACQRYWQKLIYTVRSYMPAGGVLGTSVTYPVEMRAVPTVVLTAGTRTNISAGSMLTANAKSCCSQYNNTGAGDAIVSADTIACNARL